MQTVQTVQIARSPCSFRRRGVISAAVAAQRLLLQARAAAQRVEVQYQQLPAILSIEEAIQAESFIEVRSCSSCCQLLCMCAVLKQQDVSICFACRLRGLVSSPLLL